MNLLFFIKHEQCDQKNEKDRSLFHNGQTAENVSQHNEKQRAFLDVWIFPHGYYQHCLIDSVHIFKD
jgi:hypothetical protein